MLYGSGLVNVDVARIGAYHPLPGAEDGGDDGGVGLGAADEEVHLRIGSAAGFLYEAACIPAMGILAVAGSLLQVAAGEGLQYLGKAALQVVAVEASHCCESINSLNFA